MTVYYDYDNRTRLPLEVINFISVYDLEAYVRMSSSKKGLHLKVEIDKELPVFKKYSDEVYEEMKEKFNISLLWSKRTSPWYKIKNFGVYEK